MTTPIDDLDDIIEHNVRQALENSLGEGYEIQSLLGQGGFAAVFRVRDHQLKRDIAVKVLSARLALSDQVRERFQREAETIAQLTHPNIVPLYFVGGEDDVLYLAMQLVEGASLADHIDPGGAPHADAIAILRSMADALTFAHRRGVIHRDIKPHNILIERESCRAMLTDFGIARSETNSTLTSTGVSIGTPAYMSPEQVAGDKLDGRSDIYSLGVVGYELLTGQLPFQAASARESMAKRFSEKPIPVTKLRADTPTGLASVIERCLEVEPDDRFSDASELLQALRATAPQPSGTNRFTSALKPPVLIAGMAAAIALLAWSAFSRDPRPDGLQDSASSTTASAPSVPEGMVSIPSGIYTIGTDHGHQFSAPAHRIDLSAFAIERTEVTRSAYAAFAAAEDVALPWSPEVEVDDMIPVTGVTHTEATAFCRWQYDSGRLPTEFEWEAAARGKDAFQFPWGDVWETGYAVSGSSLEGGPQPVGTLPDGATREGLLDMVGNVWEWTASRMLPYPGGSGPERGESFYVIRGGAFDTPDSIADPTRRGYLPPTTRNRQDFARTGFRCATDVAEDSIP